MGWFRTVKDNDGFKSITPVGIKSIDGFKSQNKGDCSSIGSVHEIFTSKVSC